MDEVFKSLAFFLAEERTRQQREKQEHMAELLTEEFCIKWGRTCANCKFVRNCLELKNVNDLRKHFCNSFKFFGM